MSATPLLRELLEDSTGLVSLSVHQYHRMIELGILDEGEPVELLDGFRVRKDRSARGADPLRVALQHSWAIENYSRLISKFVDANFHARSQAPITILPDNEPEPDVALVRGSHHDYRDRHPGPADVVCAIEVADSSLHRDRTTKLRIYADAGIRHYVIINLVASVIEDYRDPVVGSGRYTRSTVLRKGATLSLVLDKDDPIQFSVDKLLP